MEERRHKEKTVDKRDTEALHPRGLKVVWREAMCTKQRVKAKWTHSEGPAEHEILSEKER